MLQSFLSKPVYVQFAMIVAALVAAIALVAVLVLLLFPSSEEDQGSAGLERPGAVYASVQSGR